MKVKDINFDWLHFTESSIEIVNLAEDVIELLVKNVFIVDSDKHVQIGYHKELSLRFMKISKSVRRMVPYASKQKNSAPLAPMDTCDIDKGVSGKISFELEGALMEPHSWIESWVIECDRAQAIDNDGSVLGVYRGKACSL